MKIEFDDKNVDSIQNTIAHLVKIRKALINSCQNSNNLNIRIQNKLNSFKKEFDAINIIFNSNINSLYEGTNQNDNRYYVYVHCNPEKVLNAKDNAKHLFAASVLNLNLEPFYVGKGTGERISNLERNEGHRKIKQYLHKKNKNIEVIKIANNLTEDEAFALESKLIDIFGLLTLSKFGLLTNLDEGKNPDVRRTLYGKGVGWYLNRMKLKPY